MLTADLVEARLVGGRVKPLYVDPLDPESQGLASTLLDAFRRNVGKPLETLRAELKQLEGVGRHYLMQRALAKLLLDRAELSMACPIEPEELRRTVFERAARAYRECGPHGIDATALLAEIGAPHGIDAEAVRLFLFADLKDAQIVGAIPDTAPQRLLERYNLALAQGVLLRATQLVINLPSATPRQLRELFRAIKFHRLMHEITSSGKKGQKIVLDGPLSLFQAATKYGVAMANFLPSLLPLEKFDLRATVRFGRDRGEREFRLTHEQGLVTERHAKGQWQPEEMDWFLSQFAKLDSAWDVSAEPDILTLKGGAVIIPDYVFTHRASGRRVVFEVFGYWRKGALERRLTQIMEHSIEDLILGVGRELAADPKEFDDLPTRIYRFRSVPIAREVLGLLEAGFAGRDS